MAIRWHDVTVPMYAGMTVWPGDPPFEFSALKRMAQDYPLFGYLFEGERFDAGSKLGFLQATVEIAREDPKLGAKFAKYLRGLKL